MSFWFNSVLGAEFKHKHLLRDVVLHAHMLLTTNIIVAADSRHAAEINFQTFILSIFLTFRPPSGFSGIVWPRGNVVSFCLSDLWRVDTYTGAPRRLKFATACRLAAKHIYLSIGFWLVSELQLETWRGGEVFLIFHEGKNDTFWGDPVELLWIMIIGSKLGQSH